MVQKLVEMDLLRAEGRAKLLLIIQRLFSAVNGLETPFPEQFFQGSLNLLIVVTLCGGTDKSLPSWPLVDLALGISLVSS